MGRQNDTNGGTRNQANIINMLLDAEKSDLGRKSNPRSGSDIGSAREFVDQKNSPVRIPGKKDNTRSAPEKLPQVVQH